jgi:hypothetical protein
MVYCRVAKKNGRIAPAMRLVRDRLNLSSVMLGLVPSICNVSINETWLDPRDKPEDDAKRGVMFDGCLPAIAI